ncbi:MAG: hypothetical protein JSS83_22625 [Cyanobacteria bacterium SZAS LIN-3]|nr:hypothetical protein [Cyanobacteria bacterium SZAS LIN-3]
MAKKDQGLTKDEFVAEAQSLVADLAFYGRRAIRLKLVGGDHIAYTYNTQDEKHPIDIVLNPNCVEGVRNKERARSIVRGIGLHELLHHLHPAEPQYIQAREEGFMSLFNLIDDEQNERRGRSEDATWGAHFQTVCAHIFPYANLTKKDKIVVGIVDGEESEGDEEPTGMAASEVYRQRWNEFAIRLRRHFPKTGDDPVARALALIPDNFMDLPKDELLNLVRKVHHLLAEGVDLPKVSKQAKKTDEDKPEPEQPDDSTPASGDGIVVRQPFWKGLFKSKWSYITLGLFVLGWGALFAQGGADKWYEVAKIVCIVIIGMALATLGIWRLNKWAEERKERAAGKLKEPKQRKFWRRFKRGFAKIKNAFVDMLGERIIKLFVRFIRLPLWGMIWRGMKATGRGIKGGANWIQKGVRYLWRQRWLRIGLVALPVAFMLLILWGVVTRASQVNWWLAVLAVLALLAMLLLGWIYRKKIKDFLLGEVFVDADFNAGFSTIPPMDMESIEFNQITDIELVEADKEFLAWALPIVQPLALALREVLSKVGSVSRDKENEPVGHDVIDDIEQIYMGESNVFVDDEKQSAASLHIEVGVDCSGSMMSENATLKRGEKFKLAKLFSLLVEEATKDQRGISAHFWGFTDSAIYDCGLPGQYRTSGLVSSGGNNDSAMLWHMGQSAKASNKSVKMLFMLSDGQPSDCSWGSLRNLVLHFEGAGMVPWHFALDQIENSAFERFFTDLCGQPLEEAIMTMVGILSAIAQEQRG